jgi:hypothetical protein
MKRIAVGVFIILLLVAGSWFFGGQKLIGSLERSKTKTRVIIDRISTSTVADFKDATYSIDGQPITLVKGLAEKEIVPGSASKQITKYFGNEAVGDFNFDGKPDVAFLLTQDDGGSGTFYYIAVALGTDNGYKGTNAIFLGDRIAPQSTEFQGFELVVNYADRNTGESFSVPPSLGVSKYFEIVCDQLVTPGQVPMPTCPTPTKAGISDYTKLTTSTISMLDYQNDKYHFSFHYPYKADVGPYQDEVASNTPDFPTVEYAVYEKDNVFCLRPKDLQDFNQDLAMHNQSKANGANWCIEIQKINNEKQLLSLIQKVYGPACQYTLSQASSSDIFDVNIVSDKQGMDKSSCFPSQTYYVKYDQKIKEVAFWSTGQECQLRIYGDNWDADNCLDKTVVNSFRFK